MIALTRGISKLINSSCLRSRPFFLLNKNSFFISKKFEFLTRRNFATHSLNFKTVKLDYYLESKRYFSKKKGSKRTVEIEDESDSDEEEFEESDAEETFVDNIIQKNVPSLRLDSVVKAGLGISKKKIEQEFYAMKLRVNGKPAVKKAINVYVGDELDVIKGFSPDTSKYLTVDRIIIKGLGKANAAGQFPVKMEVLKQLTIENYEDPWNPSSIGQN